MSSNIDGNKAILLEFCIIISKIVYFLNHNLKLHEMIDMQLKYDNMDTNRIFIFLICINNHRNSCINWMLSYP